MTIKYVCITTNQPDTKPSPNLYPNPTTEQYAVVSIPLNIVTCPKYPEKFIRGIATAPFYIIRCRCHSARKERRLQRCNYHLFVSQFKRRTTASSRYELRYW